MTMLDRMRRHKNWLKWSLALVVLTFVIFYIPDFLTPSAGTGASPREVIAEVEGRRITAGEFRRYYLAQMQAYQAQFGGNMNPQLLKQLGIDQRIVQQLVEEQAALAEADRLGIRVTDEEVRERILTMPAFQESGRFIGESRYRQLLRMQRPPRSVEEFENDIRKAILIDKLRTAVTEWITISDRDIEREFTRRNEKVKLDVVFLPAGKYAAEVAVTDEELGPYFEKNKEKFRVPEKRKIRFLHLDAQPLRAAVKLTPQDLERAYNDRLEQFSQPDQVRASHVLLKTEGKDEAAVRKQAEMVLAKAKAGEDFAELAKQYSEDESNKDKGGDLDYFGRGRMVKEFEDVAFSLEPGAISDLVKTEYGFHVIKVVDKRAGSTRPFAEVRQQLEEQLTTERAQEQATTLAGQLDPEIESADDLERVARARGLKVQESGFFSQTEPIAGLGYTPQAAGAAFTLKEGQVSNAIRTSQGYAFITVSGRQDSYIPKLEEVKEQVREAVKQSRATDAAKRKAQELLPALRSAADFSAAAKAAGVEAKTTELIARGSPIGEVGMSPEVEQVAFATPVGSTSDAIVTANGAAIIKVLERQEVTPQEISAARDGLRQELLNQERSRFFASYMEKAKDRMSIEIYQETLQRVIA